MVHVRRIVQYTSVIWSPHSKHDINSAKKVQRRFTKRLKSLKHLSYDEPLAKLAKPGLPITTSSPASRFDILLQTYIWS